MSTKGSDEMHNVLDKSRKVFHIIKSTPVDVTYDEHYVIGLTPPYAGKCRWVRTLTAQTAAQQATTITNAMAL
jgi:hypothetical protein